jgi:hypothetical protein
VLVFPLVSSVAEYWKFEFEFALFEFRLFVLMLFGKVRVGPYSADSFRTSPLPTTRLEFCRVGGGCEDGTDIGMGNWGRVFVE